MCSLQSHVQTDCLRSAQEVLAAEATETVVAESVGAEGDNNTKPVEEAEEGVGHGRRGIRKH